MFVLQEMRRLVKHLKPEYANVEEHAIPLDTPLIARLCGKSKDKVLDYICSMCTPAEVISFDFSLSPTLLALCNLMNVMVPVRGTTPEPQQSRIN